MKPKLRRKTAIEQMSAVRVKYKHFKVNAGRDSLKAVGKIQPTPRSQEYKIEIRFTERKSPRVKIVDPVLTKNFKGEEIPHFYKEGHLCLYYPKFGEFQDSDLLTDTILPWTSLWLYYYEVWQVTGEWLGGGMHPPKTKSEKKQ